MMFLVMFSSLTLAMAILSQGNLRTAETHAHVVRAMGSAETGLLVGRKRLQEAVRAVYVDRGTVDADFAHRVWMGTPLASDGRVEVNDDPWGRGFDANGIADLVVAIFSDEGNIVSGDTFPDEAVLHAAPNWADLDEYEADGWITTPVVAIDGDGTDQNEMPSAFQLTFAPLLTGDIRIISEGYSSIGQLGSSYSYSRDVQTGNSTPMTRTVMQDFRLSKRHEHAIVSPSRIMIGKNVLVEGNLGARYTDVEQNNGHPMVIRSDFYGLNATLDLAIEAFYENLADFDVDADNRLRVGHSIESGGIPGADEDFDGDGAGDNAFADATGDGYVDDFDLFMNFYDDDGNGQVVLSADLTEGTPAEGMGAEFEEDDDLALLIDGARPDRNNNGISGWDDSDEPNGRWDAGEEIADYDPTYAIFPDVDLGWRDGVIDRRDRYAKVNGRLVFAVEENEWSDAQDEGWQPQLQGPITAVRGDAPVQFDADDEELPELDASTFADSGMDDLADGDNFWQQVATNLSIGEADLATYTEASTDEDDVRYWRADLDSNYVHGITGRHLYEKMPFSSPTFSDWYVRPRFENMVFYNVEVPRGLNALFVGCTFVGVTNIRSYEDNSHPLWSEYGKMAFDDSIGRPVALDNPPPESSFEPLPMDKSDFDAWNPPGPFPEPDNYDTFLDPPVIDGTVVVGAMRDTKRYSNNIRFHDCLFVGSLISDIPQEYTHVRNKLQFTGATRFTTEHPDEPNDPDLNPDDDDLQEIEKTSLMVPNYSVDIGSFNSPTDTYDDSVVGQNVQLGGTIVAGVLDIRGTADIDGTLLLTFAPVAGEGPLEFNGEAVGNPAGFNATLGYFGPEDGDGESLNPADLPTVDGEKVVGWDLDGDGIADLDPDSPPTPDQIAAGATAVPFYGYGRINFRWNPDLPMPDGILLPMSAVDIAGSYKEGRTH